MVSRVLCVDLTLSSFTLKEVESEYGSSLPLALSLYDGEGIVLTHGDGAFASDPSFLSFCVFKSPQNNDMTYGILEGSTFSHAMISLSIDAIVISGIARKLSYAVISNEGCQLRFSEAYSGASPKSFFSLVSGEGEVLPGLATGVSGENSIYISTVISSDGKSFGRGGLGAIFGRKNLKGIVLKSPSPSFPDSDLTKALDGPKKRKKAGKRSSLSYLADALDSGALPVSYFSGERDLRCLSLSVRDFEIMGVEPLSLESVAALGCNAGIYSPDKVATLKEKCDEFALSDVEAGELVSYMRSLSELEEYHAVLTFLYDISTKKGRYEGYYRGVRSVQGSYLTSSRECLFDFRGSYAAAMFSCFGDVNMPMLIDVELSLTRRYPVRTLAPVLFYVRAFYYAFLSLGISPERLVPFFRKALRHQFLPLALIRKRIMGIKLPGFPSKDLLLLGMSLMAQHDGMETSEKTMESHFVDDVNFLGSRLEWSVFLSSYRLEEAYAGSLLGKN